MRTEILMRIVCTDCGAKLPTVYKTDVSEMASKTDLWESGDVTGATVNYIGIYVHPCRSCIEKYTMPAKRLAEAVRAITETVT